MAPKIGFGLIEDTMNVPEMVPARATQLPYFREIPLYAKVGEERFTLYKPAGMTISEMRIGTERLPSPLYISRSDKLKGLQETQEAFNKNLRSQVASGETEAIKTTVISIVEETLLEPRSGGLEGLSETVDILIGDYAKESNVVKNLIDLSGTDYSSTIHSINVMALSLRYAFSTSMSAKETKTLGLSALLHDTGKSKLPPSILQAPRRLTDEEFRLMQTHCTEGYDIITNCSFNDHRIALVALEHHEKRDGTGYPVGKKNCDTLSEIVAIIDCYEAITTDERPYRNAMIPLEALYLLKKEVENGKYRRKFFEAFAYSLTRDL